MREETFSFIVIFIFWEIINFRKIFLVKVADENQFS